MTEMFCIATDAYMPSCLAAPNVFTPRVLRSDGISLWDCWLALCAERIGSEIPFSATTTYPCPCVVSFKQKRLVLHACNLGDKKE